MEIAGVTEWAKIVGKTVRVRSKKNKLRKKTGQVKRYFSNGYQKMKTLIINTFSVTNNLVTRSDIFRHLRQSHRDVTCLIPTLKSLYFNYFSFVSLVFYLYNQKYK